MSAESQARNDVTHLPSAAEEVLAEARAASAGRAGRTLRPGAGAPLKQALLALTAGTVLADHESPGEATLQVITGRVRLTARDATFELAEGEHAAIPPQRHGLEGLKDSVVLITVAHR
jgi:quercetin dioxygenase-like cupin family protein